MAFAVLAQILGASPYSPGLWRDVQDGPTLTLYFLIMKTSDLLAEAGSTREGWGIRKRGSKGTGRQNCYQRRSSSPWWEWDFCNILEKKTFLRLAREDEIFVENFISVKLNSCISQVSFPFVLPREKSHLASSRT